MPDKLLRASVSWLGHVDVKVEDLEAARRVVLESYCPGAVIGDFALKGEGDDYGTWVRWERANWWRPDRSPEKYDGCIVLVYDYEAERPGSKKAERTLGDLVREVVSVQNACNLSGVIHAWSRSITDLRRVLGDPGTDEINKHFVNVLWADKVAHLTGSQTLGHESVTAAYAEAYKAIGGR